MLTTIKRNAIGDLVKVAKYLTGYAQLNCADELFDEQFEEFIVNWQTDNNLTADGIIGPKSWTKLAGQIPTCSTSKNKKSAYTCAVQILIGGLNVDGIYGKLTKNAVAAYQGTNALSVDGICGPRTWASLITGTATPSGSKTSGEETIEQTNIARKVINKCIHYLQWDSRWKNIKYSTHTAAQTIGNSGCGPTAVAQILATFIDPSITPVEICALSVENGYRTYDDGTKWGLFEFIYKRYKGFAKFMATDSVKILKSALAQGALAVCSMNSKDNNFWTKGGHLITAIGYDEKGYIYANDPNKSECPRKQHQDLFQTCMKQAFIFWPAINVNQEPNDDDDEYLINELVDDPIPEVEDELPHDEDLSIIGNSGTEIIDISKWQGNIDFDTLMSNVALVIARASCGSDKDAKFDSYASDMNERGIPFGVYCYSYAGTESKARDEARKIIQYAKKYSPLFYVMDAEESKINHDSIAAFADELRKQGAKRIGCYVAHNHYKDYKYDSLRDLFDFTWIPRYGKNDGTINGSTHPSYMCDLWQYTSAGKIAGINGNVDKNIITGDGKMLDWFLGIE